MVDAMIGSTRPAVRSLRQTCLVAPSQWEGAWPTVACSTCGCAMGGFKFASRQRPLLMSWTPWEAALDFSEVEETTDT